jgi:hypothetical protein
MRLTTVLLVQITPASPLSQPQPLSRRDGYHIYDDIGFKGYCEQVVPPTT